MAYWNAVLDAGFSDQELAAISEWIHKDSTRIRATSASAAKEGARQAAESARQAFTEVSGAPN